MNRTLRRVARQDLEKDAAVFLSPAFVTGFNPRLLLSRRQRNWQVVSR
jgi:hypothetical protein